MGPEPVNDIGRALPSATSTRNAIALLLPTYAASYWICARAGVDSGPELLASGREHDDGEFCLSRRTASAGHCDRGAAAAPVVGGVAVPAIRRQHDDTVTTAAGPCPTVTTLTPPPVPVSPTSCLDHHWPPPANPDFASVAPCRAPRLRCVGLAESEAVLGPRPVTHAKVGHEPTGVTSHPMLHSD